jgi:heme-degrading monooxygenase HmoA
MFSVLFEVNPESARWDDYLDRAKLLRPELEQIDGFVANVRYRSLTRDGWILSLSEWRDEKALVRWRTKARHHDVQLEGRQEILHDYRLRVGQVTQDTEPPAGLELREQRLDETEVGPTTVVLTTARRTAEAVTQSTPQEIAVSLGLVPAASGLVSWDVYDAVLKSGDVILMASWRDDAAARVHEQTLALPDDCRTRRVRVVRDYGLKDRREAPQYYPDVVRAGDDSA